jgi:hypothetical protein
LKNLRSGLKLSNYLKKEREKEAPRRIGTEFAFILRFHAVVLYVMDIMCFCSDTSVKYCEYTCDQNSSDKEALIS